jgi:Ca-activated chloride channel homolog
MTRRHAPRLLAALLIALLAGSCDRSGPDFTIVSGSENEVLEPLVMAFCREQGAQCHMKYLGSLDIALGLKAGGTLDADAVWPASSIWIDVFDTSRHVRSVKSIAQMPVILGVRQSKAQMLEWIGKPVASRDILAAVDAHQLSFLMSSATQSNSGATAYLAMLAASLGKVDPLAAADLDNERARDMVRRLLRGVARSAGSSGWLADLYRESDEKGVHYDAMWNYEAVIKETNDQLRAAGHELLYAVYPTDGVALADSPLGFVDRGRGAEVERFFDALEAYLLGDDAQAKIAATGRRVGPTRSEAISDPATNIDTGRRISVVRPPEPAVIEKALTLYQEALRRPSLTALCLDVSRSMAGLGKDQLLDAMRFLLTPERTREVLVQWLPEDRILVLPFDGHVRWTATASGAESDQAALLTKTLGLRANDGTDFYDCAARALTLMKPILDQGNHLPAIVIMTDGKSQGTMARFEQPWRADGGRVPVFGVTFGNDADRSQLDRLAKLTGGRVFDGTSSLAEAFRAVRGYN